MLPSELIRIATEEFEQLVQRPDIVIDMSDTVNRTYDGKWSIDLSAAYAIAVYENDCDYLFRNPHDALFSAKRLRNLRGDIVERSLYPNVGEVEINYMKAIDEFRLGRLHEGFKRLDIQLPDAIPVNIHLFRNHGLWTESDTEQAIWCWYKLSDMLKECGY